MNQTDTDICIVGGAGHVGLPLSLVFASKGKRVRIFDIDQRALDAIALGKMPFMEQGAQPLLEAVLKSGRLEMTSDPAAVAGAKTVLLTIGTPIDEFLNPTLRMIKQCVDMLLPHLSDGQLIVLRSTVYPTVTDWLSKYLVQQGKKILVAFCPERIVQGHAIDELQTLPQIVSGSTPEAEEAAAQLFGSIAPSIVRLTPTEAEFAKLFSNAFRYIEFAVANQFYTMATTAGVDYYRVIEGMQEGYARAGHMPRAGLAAGPCLFKDTMQLAAFSKNEFSIGHAAMLVNEGLPSFLVDQLRQQHPLDLLTVGILGMAFKADNDDRRSSLSYKMKRLLSFHAGTVLTTDPYVTGDPELLPLEEVVRRSDILVLCAPHSDYRNLDTAGKTVVDVWNFWPRQPVERSRRAGPPA
ncbi:MAG TPA: nucleotide sugar dehydrogenase [Vicinamibacterales bacterium]|nr:nucleotide sugar dehydrogenase [Vicinamibacterales bacterium]